MTAIGLPRDQDPGALPGRLRRTSLPWADTVRFRRAAAESPRRAHPVRVRESPPDSVSVRCRSGAVVVARRLATVKVTASFLAILLATTLLMRFAIADDTAVLRWASTNIDNLTARPVRVFVASALFLPDDVWLPYAVVLGLSMGSLERRFGAWRTVAIFASAHIGATILTEGGVWAGIALGLRPAGEMNQLDVGVSYGMYASIAAALLLLPARWRGRPLRRTAVGLAALAVLVPLATDVSMTTIGHVLSLSTGFLWWPALQRWTERDRAHTIYPGADH